MCHTLFYLVIYIFELHVTDPGPFIHLLRAVELVKLPGVEEEASKELISYIQTGRLASSQAHESVLWC